jgi:hypothetical protein
MTWKMLCQHGHCHIINELDTSAKTWSNWVVGSIFENIKIGDLKTDF